jgi:hypothetical protein
MTEKLKKYKGFITSSALSLGLFMTGVSVWADPDPVPGDAGYPVFASEGALDSLITDVADVLFTGLTSAMAIIGALIGLFFIIRLIRKWISRGK